MEKMRDRVLTVMLALAILGLALACGTEPLPTTIPAPTLPPAPPPVLPPVATRPPAGETSLTPVAVESFDAGVEGWRGMFVLATKDIEEARRLVAPDPAIQKGEMIAEYHPYFGSAALMLVNDLHKRIDRP